MLQLRMSTVMKKRAASENDGRIERPSLQPSQEHKLRTSDKSSLSPVPENDYKLRDAGCRKIQALQPRSSFFEFGSSSYDKSGGTLFTRKTLSTLEEMDVLELPISHQVLRHIYSYAEAPDRKAAIHPLERKSRVLKSERSIILRKKIPKLTQKDILWYRLPLQEAICTQLKMEGYVDALQEITKLLEMDHEIHDEADKNKYVKRLPYLKEVRVYMQKLAESLSDAERAGCSGSPILEAIGYLRLAEYFQLQHKPWWWIATRMYEKAIMLSKSLVDRDGEKRTALYRLQYSKFLVKDETQIDKAIAEAKIVSESCRGKSWLAFEDGTDITLSEESHKHLSALYAKKAAIVPDAEEAIHLYKKAVQSALQSSDLFEYAKATLKLSQARFETGSNELALSGIKKYQKISKQLESAEMLCLSHRELGLIYISIGKSEEAQKELELYLQMSTDHELFGSSAEAHCMLGEIHLRQDHYDVAYFHLNEAFLLYDHLRKNDERDLARVLCGVAAAHESLCHYIRHLVLSNVGYKDSMERLMQWKEYFIPFWTEEQTKMRSTQVLPTYEEPSMRLQEDESMNIKRIIDTTDLSLVENMDLVINLSRRLTEFVVTFQENFRSLSLF